MSVDEKCQNCSKVWSNYEQADHCTDRWKDYCSSFWYVLKGNPRIAVIHRAGFLSSNTDVEVAGRICVNVKVKAVRDLDGKTEGFF